VRDEQRKFIKYNHLVANLLAFHNVVAISNAVRRMEEGFEVRNECVAELSRTRPSASTASGTTH
jgi:hypothetical protein